MTVVGFDQFSFSVGSVDIVVESILIDMLINEKIKN
jgi:hypothetical protein